MHPRYWLSGILCLSLAALPVVQAAKDKEAAAQTREFQRKLADNEKILLALDRLTFGPRPGDVEQVQKIGLKKWIELQLSPDRVDENRVVAERLQSLESIRMTPEELALNYPSPQMLLALANGRQPYPQDPERRAYLEKLAARYQNRKLNGKAGDEKDENDKAEAMSEQRQERLAELRKTLSDDQLRILRRGTNEEKIALLRSLPLDQLTSVIFLLPRPGVGKKVEIGQKAGNEERLALLNTMPTDLRRRVLMATAPMALLGHDLIESKIYRAVYSNRQLQEVLADFWFNHFNVFFDKGADRFLTTAYDQQAIRPHVLGHFSQLLKATAQSPAMLFYLDNWQSVDPKAMENLQGRFPLMAKVTKGKVRGLNENYARELLELHTLGVDGGYSQKDIVEVARCFTGWTIRQPQRGGEFFFNDRVHDRGEKTVLGVRIPAGGGIEDGYKVLDIVAHHPSTARFVSRKLAQRFVADEPPQALVDAMAATFRKTDGDIRQVMRTMIESPEFFSAGAYRAKLKSPLEMVVSAVRAVDAEVTNAFVLGQQIGQLGQPLYRKQEPTGYSNSSEEWVNSGTLLARMNFAQALVQNKIPGVKVDPARFSSEDRSEVARSVLFRSATPATLEAINRSLQEQQNLPDMKHPALVAGLVIGSPEFQRR